MSYTFSRRDFMKYSALTAVAVAGAGMFTGCGSNPNRPVGKAGSTLKPGGNTCAATLLNADANKISYTNKTLICRFNVKATQTALQVTESHFQVDVTIDGKTKYYRATAGSNQVTLIDNSGTNSLEVNKTCTPVLQVKDIELKNATKVLVKYWPLDAAKGVPTDSYNDVYATWDITDVIKELTASDED